LRSEQNGEEVACLKGRKKNPNIKVAVDKRGRTGHNDEESKAEMRQ